MLARLEEIDGVRAAETDKAADYLRLSVRDTAAATAARELLVTLGYGSELAATEPQVARWFGVGAVGELSLIEAGVIADRVLRRTRDAFRDDAAARLRAAIVGVLHACFVNTQLTSTPSGDEFRRDCVARAVAATTPIVGDSEARVIGRLLDEDMRRAHSDAS